MNVLITNHFPTFWKDHHHVLYLFEGDVLIFHHGKSRSKQIKTGIFLSNQPPNKQIYGFDSQGSTKLMDRWVGIPRCYGCAACVA